MNKKLLSVIAAASLAMTSFAALAVTASAASTVNLSTLTDNYEVQDGTTLTGTLGGNYMITIADGATVTLEDASINADGEYTGEWAGITPLGDATIVLEGTNTVKGFSENYPGIFAAKDKTLTIKGTTGSLTVSSKGYGAGIGGGFYISCGNILIEGGAITATGGDDAAGIGCGVEGECGNIKITDGVTNVTAIMGGSAQYSIGAAKFATCGTVTIGGTVTDGIVDSPFIYVPATATYEQVGAYDAQFDGDTAVSLWRVNVKTGTDSITSLDVKLGEYSSDDDTYVPTITDGHVVLGVITNLTSAGVKNLGGFTVFANEKAIQTNEIAAD